MSFNAAAKRWLSVRGYGLVASSLFRATTPPATMRARFERFAAVSIPSLQRKFPQAVFRQHSTGLLEIESVRAVKSPRCTILHLHGGGFVMGSPRSYRNRAVRMSYRFDAEVFVPEYRLAPEHPFPAALDDALEASEYVRALSPQRPVLLTGDSAGGNLALSLLVLLRDRGGELPRGAVLLSPWTDLTASGSSLQTNARRDRWISRRHLQEWACHYAGANQPGSPALSPLFADLAGLPPLFVLAGEDEVLLDDAVRLVDAARRAGTDVRPFIGRGMQHDFPLTLPWLDESRAAWAAMREFVDEHTGLLLRSAPRRPELSTRKEVAS